MTSTAPHPAHQALYRRWRAQTFGQIVGQEAVVETLHNAVRAGAVAHAMLFVGPRGTGKTSLARIVAKALNCTDLRDGEPCDRCAACVAVREGRALDVIEMDAASNNRVDDIRELLPRIYTAPSDLRRKVFIVDEVQRIKEGWDLLLKTLEEPPDHVAFVFCTTDSSQIRPAVLSRVQRFDFRRLTVPEIEGKLRTILAAEEREADDAAIELIARLAAGGMRDAESMLDQLLGSSTGRLDADLVRELLGLAEAESVEAFARALAGVEPAAGLAILAELEDRGRDLRAFLDQVVESLRAAIADGLADPARRGSLPALSAAAARVSAIDPTRSGAGGLRLQLELAVLTAGSTVQSRSEAAVPSAPVPVERQAPDARPPDTRPPAAETAPGTSSVPPSAEARSAEQPPSAEQPAAPEAPAAPGPPPGPSPLATDAEPAAGLRSTGRRRPGAGASPVEVATGTPAATPASPTPATERAAPATELPGPGTPTSSEAVPGAAPPAAASADDDRALGALRDQWPEIVAYISQHPPTKPVINACRPVAVDGNVVTLGFPEGQAFLRDVAERRRANLEAGIGHFLGRAVAVRCVASNVDPADPLPLDPESARLVSEARRIFADDLVDVGDVG